MVILGWTTTTNFKYGWQCKETMCIYCMYISINMNVFFIWCYFVYSFQHIYTSNGVSLHELSISLSKNRKYSTNESDDLCSICLQGGNLFCCNTCPRAFHKGQFSTLSFNILLSSKLNGGSLFWG